MKRLLPLMLLLGGCTLIDQNTFNPNASAAPVIPPAPVVPPPAPTPPGPPPLLTLRMAQAGDYADALRKAVALARARKPGVLFDVVQIVGAEPAPPDDAAAVARAIVAQGIPASRVRLLARPEAGAPGREVRVYVR